MNYWDYIKVEELLSLQMGYHDRDEDVHDDETLFIVVHQIYELWFKLVLRELTSVRRLFRRNPVPDETLAAATRSLRRCATIFEAAADHFRVVETLTTRDYLAFRDQLVGASGFQSAQLREIEILLGIDEAKRIPCFADESYKDALRGAEGESSPALDRVERRIAEGPSLREAVYDWLARTPIDGSSEEDHVQRYLDAFVESHEAQARSLVEAARARFTRDKDVAIIEARYAKETAAAAAFLRADDRPEGERGHRRHVRAALVFIESHRELPRLSWPREVCEALLILEQRMIIWRQRHARMVERVIGRRVGTGGSGGVAYLDETALRYRIFDDLWEVRTILLREQVVPSLENPEDYRLRIQD
jgi:tryptophan 2,3-dioxygenase